ncbi:MAG: zinc-ribbon domain-containing protein [Clostridia bacterium]|nr:zinc-ribbon domain-containing protein [Clostridia bacterium]
MDGKRNTASITLRHRAVCALVLLIAAATVFVNVHAQEYDDTDNPFIETTTQAAPETTTSWIQGWVSKLSGDTTAPQETTTLNTPVQNTGNGQITQTPATQAPTQAPTQAYNYNTNPGSGQVVYVYTTAPTIAAPVTTVPATIPEETSTINSALSDLLGTTAPVLVATTREPFTLNSVGIVDVEEKTNTSSSWKTIALIGAAVVFVMLAALLIVLMTQKKRLGAAPAEGRRPYNADSLMNLPTAGVTEFNQKTDLQQERVKDYFEGVESPSGPAEMNMDFTSGASRREAHAIREAAQSGMISGGRTYGTDDIVRKYTSEPVGFSSAGSGERTPAEILNRTDNMLLELDSYTAAVSGFTETEQELKSAFTGGGYGPGVTRRCPKCGASVPPGDLFCHECGEYAG